ncbi:hypothetical protein AB0D04_40395 [Streptomyces sp. NPDC048483]|uniref:hypothetical protein n=1 Tax=Streptomyces sp. NPDC048483 TaxID=3154927 RepID=UPI00343C2F4E
MAETGQIAFHLGRSIGGHRPDPEEEQDRIEMVQQEREEEESKIPPEVRLQGERRRNGLA